MFIDGKHMKDIISELKRIKEKCSKIEFEFEKDEIVHIKSNLEMSISQISRAWSNSWLGYQAYVYWKNFTIPPPGYHFSIEWGFHENFYGPTPGKWQIPCRL